MTQIAFHVNVPDKLAYSCRLLRKAYLSGARVMVTAEPDVLLELDHWLWRFSATEFVPHCRAGAPEATLAASPIVLAKSLTVCPHHEVLLNLGQRIPAGFEAFERLIEVVQEAHDEVLTGRDRWRHYVAKGYTPIKHERVQPGVPA